MLHIDNIDLKIKSLLQKNGRITNSSLASEVNLSTAATLERVRKLENREIITGYTALVCAKKLDLNFDFLVGIRLKGLIKANIASLSKTILKIPQITSCYQVMGDETNFIIRVVVSEINTYYEKVVYPLNDTGLVEFTHGCLLLNSIKETGLCLENIQIKKI
jgi:Lrp/AsnC family leucine-responsive transcriptional regulator